MGFDLLMLTLGGGLLFYGGEWLVNGIESLSDRLGVPAVVVAVFVMGFGTSAPELFVAIEAMLNEAPDIAVGNVVGSNIANLLLVLALAACITPLTVDKEVLHIDGGAMLLGGVALGAVAFDGVVSRSDAVLLLLGMAAYLALRLHSPGAAEDSQATQDDSLLSAALWCVAALVALPVGSHLFVEGAISIAARLGASEALIGLTVVAIGTSLPEMASCIAAAMRRRADMILGGILGSNVFNGTVVLGSAALVAPVAVAQSFVSFWIPVMIAAALLTIVFLRTDFILSRREASVMLVGYAAIFLS